MAVAPTNLINMILIGESAILRCQAHKLREAAKAHICFAPNRQAAPAGKKTRKKINSTLI
jgi:hypothetical protein